MLTSLGELNVYTITLLGTLGASLISFVFWKLIRLVHAKFQILLVFNALLQAKASSKYSWFKAFPRIFPNALKFLIILLVSMITYGKRKLVVYQKDQIRTLFRKAVIEIETIQIFHSKNESSGLPCHQIVHNFSSNFSCVNGNMTWTNNDPLSKKSQAFISSKFTRHMA